MEKHSNYTVDLQKQIPARHQSTPFLSYSLPHWSAVPLLIFNPKESPEMCTEKTSMTYSKNQMAVFPFLKASFSPESKRCYCPQI